MVRGPRTDPRRPTATGRPGGSPGQTRRRLQPELRPYLLAGVAYITLGLLVKQVMAWWSYAMLFLLLALWWLPSWWARRRRRR